MSNDPLMAEAASVLNEISHQAGATAAAFELRYRLSLLLAEMLTSELRPEFAGDSEVRQELESLFSATSSDGEYRPLASQIDIARVVYLLRIDSPEEHIAERLRLYTEQVRARDQRIEPPFSGQESHDSDRNEPESDPLW